MIQPARIGITGLTVLALVVGACRSTDPATAERHAPAQTSTSTSTGAVAVDPWAPQAQRALPPPQVTDPFPRPMFWAATRDGKTTYLFGTLHGGVNAERRIPRWVWDQFDAASTLVLEVNLQDVELSRWTIRPEGRSLRDELGEAYWARFEEMVTPFAASMLDHQATAVATLRASGYGAAAPDQAVPMDGELLVRAQGLKKQLVFLETAAFQGDMFTRLYDLASLRRLIDRRAELAAVNPGFTDAYVEGDDTKLTELARAQFRLVAADDRALDRFMDTLLIARNRGWIPKLEQAHAAGGAFVAVGVLHLTGKDSVLDLLRSRGFEVRRLTGP